MSPVARLTVIDPAPILPIITAPASAYPGASGLSVSVPAQPVGSTYAWSILNANGSVTGSGNTATVTVGSTGGTTTILGCIVTNAAGVSSSQGSTTINIVSNPDATITFSSGAYITPIGALSPTTPGVTGTAQVTSQAGYSYAWGISNGTLQTGAGTNQVTFTASSTGPVQLNCTVTNTVTGGSSPGTASVTAVPAPVQPVFTVPNDVTSTVSANAVITSPQGGCSFAWTATNSAQTTGAGSSFGFTPVTPGTPVTLSCIATNQAQTPSTPATGAAANVWPLPTATLVASPLNLPPGGGTVTLTGAFTGGSSEIGNGGPYSYNLGSQGGPAGTWNLTPTQASGTFTYAVSTTNGAGYVVYATATVAVAPVWPVVSSLTASDLRVAPGMSATVSGSVQGYPGVQLDWWVSQDGSAWQHLTSSPWGFDGTAMNGYLSSPVGVTGLPLTGGTALSAYGLATSVTLSNLPLSPNFQVQLSASYGATDATPTSLPTTGIFSLSQPIHVPVLAPYSSSLMAAGNNHNLLISQGIAWACGRNNCGQLGNGYPTFADSTYYQFVSDSYGYAIPWFLDYYLDTIVQVDAWGDHSLALDSGGYVYWWGNGEPAGVADQNFAQTVNLPVDAGTPVMLANNSTTSFVLMSNGLVYPWAAGASSVTASPASITPFLIAIDASDTDVNGNQVVVGLDSANGIDVSASPYNTAHTLMAPTGSPTLVAVYIRGDAMVYALDATGVVWQWADTAASTVPQAVTPPPSVSQKCVALSKSNGYILALGSDGVPWAYGANNSNGQLGLGNTTPYTSGYFQAITGTARPIQGLLAGPNFALALDHANNMWGWGFYGVGEQVTSQTAIVGLYPVNGYIDLPVGTSSDVIVYGNPGPSNYTNPPYWFYIWGSDPGLYFNLTPNGSTQFASYGSNSFNLPPSVVYSSSLARHALSIDNVGNLYSWGLNSAGQLGTGDTSAITGTTVVSPYPSSLTQPFAKAAAGTGHSMVLDTNGGLWLWGNNARGQVDGFGYASPFLAAPHQMQAPTVGENPGAWAGMAAGQDFSVGLTTQGKVYVWGDNTHAQAAQTPNGSILPPTYVPTPGLTWPVTQVSAGAYHVLALDGDGNVWAWGGNQFGQVGNGNLGFVVQAPAMVLGPNNPFMPSAPITQIVAGPTFSLALDAQGNLWAWGDNTTGVLYTTPYNLMPTPYQILSSASYLLEYVTVTANSVVVLDNQGYLRTWGWNPNGMLGLGFTSFSKTPSNNNNINNLSLPPNPGND